MEDFLSCATSIGFRSQNSGSCVLADAAAPLLGTDHIVAIAVQQLVKVAGLDARKLQ